MEVSLYNGKERKLNGKDFDFQKMGFTGILKLQYYCPLKKNEHSLPIQASPFPCFRLSVYYPSPTFLLLIINPYDHHGT